MALLDIVPGRKRQGERQKRSNNERRPFVLKYDIILRLLGSLVIGYGYIVLAY